MKMSSVIPIVLFLLSAPASAGDRTLDRMAWLSGCWASVGGEAGSGEQWMPPAGRSMLGMGRTVRDGATAAFEFLRIVEDEEGRIVLVALPSGQRPTTFRLLNQSDNELVFENPEHDYPQRVIYRLMPGDILVGRIEGTVNGDARSVEFPMKKADCGSGNAA